ncbi:1-acyl-sn-glycerol-3-phosphate acyltransferase [Parvibaculum indicum]|uniref:lysophospholipid acyltransferase family protein n=1 Tax=Parvibaculum indicum TaxID=562969 RepID=UPI001421F8D9|nr:lysophospholipid acyltransferase family protein [Parvibaculum indicum]NIJ41431.1 1-acyl-sn-glycerol-3-phosphate acyltransferase [Parvibaculum indicum]
MLWLRSTFFNLSFWLMSIIMCILATPLFLAPRGWTVRAMNLWSRLTMFLLRVCAGTRYEVRGRIPEGAVLVAAKHQSMWDTIIATTLLRDPAIVMKKELLMIPYYGWYSLKTRMIAIDRGSGSAAIRKLIAQAKAALGLGRPVLIFPEGTRMAPDAAPDYKPGVAALYRQLDVPCVPVAVNSGIYWARRGFAKRPGTIVIEFLDPIPPGLDRKAFMAELEKRIEPATAKLVAEARGKTPALSEAAD